MKKYLAFVLIAAVSACSGSGSGKPAERVNGYTQSLKTKADTVMHEVMEAHDAAMAKMGRLQAYKIQAGKLIDSLSKKSASVKHTEAFVAIRKKLDEAENGMEKWMEEFNLDSAANKHAGQLEYLEKEKEKVKSVSERLINTVKQADSLFKKER